MSQVRFHGRGGQGVVTAAELLAAAAFSEGRHAQAFPSFGSKRMEARPATRTASTCRPFRSASTGRPQPHQLGKATTSVGGNSAEVSSLSPVAVPS